MNLDLSGLGVAVRFVHWLSRMEAIPSGARTHVLLVGAGPVGLATAIGLRQQAHAVRIIDLLTTETKRNYPTLERDLQAGGR